MAQISPFDVFGRLRFSSSRFFTDVIFSLDLHLPFPPWMKMAKEWEPFRCLALCDHWPVNISDGGNEWEEGPCAIATVRLRLKPIFQIIAGAEA